MTKIIERLVNRYEQGQMTRRSLIVALSTIFMGKSATATQSPNPPIAARTLNHVALRVSDVQRSQEFYQRLFGFSVQNTRGSTPILPVGSGPEYLALSAARNGSSPSIYHYCFGVEGFNPDAIMETLAEHDVEGRVSMQGGSVPLLYFHDPDGIEVQLQDVSYCGGEGPLGNVCP